jgi:hypothetical protein
MRIRDSIAAIALKYGIFSVRTSIASPSWWSTHGTLVKIRDSAANQQVFLLQLNIARPSMDVEKHAAISNLALDMVAGKSTLRGHLMVVELERS